LILWLVNIYHNLICLVHSLVNNHLLRIYWLIYHHWLRHWLRTILSLIQELSILHGIFTISCVYKFVVASICISKFRLLGALRNLVVHWGAFHQMALAALRLVTSIGSTAPSGIMLRRALSLAGYHFLIFRLLRDLMIRIHITSLNWM